MNGFEIVKSENWILEFVVESWVDTVFLQERRLVGMDNIRTGGGMRLACRLSYEAAWKFPIHCRECLYLSYFHF